MKRILSTILFAGLLGTLGIGAWVAMPRGVDPVQQAGTTLELTNQAINATKYNAVSLPLDASTVITPFNAQGFLDYIGPSASQVANLNPNSQALDFWDGNLGFGVVNGIVITEPFPLKVGSPYLIQVDENAPSTLTVVGDVPPAGSIQFDLVGVDPCNYNEISIPLDQSTISNGAELAASIGNVNFVAKLNVESQSLDFWDVTLGFGVIDGLIVNDPNQFPVTAGYPYFVCVTGSGDGTQWP
ncbi:MAG: hypothetical protein QNJ45_00380 [Ardenticatenaceae bacterium]|nr:hypothetical protein [Ardenticatenaceae bacterium]